MNAVVEQAKEFTLTQDQQAALNAFQEFLLDPHESVFVLRGYSGCGKSTLVKEILDQYPSMVKAIKLIDPDSNPLSIELTATTNKAAEALQIATHAPVRTIHSFLGLRVSTNYKTGETNLVKTKNTLVKSGYLLFVDEASYIDSKLLQTILSLMQDSKVVFIGDPAQLTPVKSTRTPVFDAPFPGAALTQVVRQAEGNPIIDLSTKFREAVNTGKFFSFKPDNHHVIHLDRDAFDEEIKKEFLRPDWKFNDSKFLAWTNNRVITYNHAINDLVKGDPHFQVGDYAVCNSYLSFDGCSIKTDEMVLITLLGSPEVYFDIPGRWVHLAGKNKTFFLPNHIQDVRAKEKTASIHEQYTVLHQLSQRVIDLRCAYACTINKAQGSTFDRVFIDLDDVSKCKQGELIARMLYVAVSRARHTVYLTGDIN